MASLRVTSPTRRRTLPSKRAEDATVLDNTRMTVHEQMIWVKGIISKKLNGREIDRQLGFCFGVENAVEIAERALLNGEKVFSLGPIIHNDREVERLSSLGLVSIDHDQFMNLTNCRVLIPSSRKTP